MRSGKAIGGFAAGFVLTGLLGWVATPTVRQSATAPKVDYRFVAMTDDWDDLCNELTDQFGIHLNYDDSESTDFITFYNEWLDDFIAYLEENNWIDPMDEAAEWGHRILEAHGVGHDDLDMDQIHDPPPQ